MNESTNIPAPRVRASKQCDSHLKNVQVRMPRTLHQQFETRLKALNTRNGMGLSMSAFVVQTLEKYGTAQLERAEKFYQRYRHQKVESQPGDEISVVPTTLQQ
jgi:hypothetical protein